MATTAVNSLAALRALPIPTSSNDRVVVLGHTAAGDGGEGGFVGDPSSTEDDNGATVIKPTGAPGAGRWVRVVEDKHINVRWFGAKGDGSTDDTAAIVAAIDAIPTLTVGSFYPCGKLVVPPGYYKLTSAITINKRVHICGTGPGGNYGDSWLKFTNTAGIIFDTGSGGSTDSSGSVLENVALECASGVDPDLDGVTIKAFNVTCRNVHAVNFTRDGFHITGNTAGSPVTDANLWRLENCHAWTNGRHGLYVHDNDANAGYCLGLDAENNIGAGVYEDSFLGNHYFGCHTSGNGQSYFCANSGVNFSTFIGCYAEADQDPASFGQAVVIGGDIGSGWTGGATVIGNQFGHWSIRGDSVTPSLWLNEASGQTEPHAEAWTVGGAVTLRIDTDGRMWVGRKNSSTGGPDTYQGGSYVGTLRIAGATGSVDNSGAQWVVDSQWVANLRAYISGSANFFTSGRFKLELPDVGGTEVAVMTAVADVEEHRLGVGVTTPNQNAVLDLTSTLSGFLPPRMTTTQRQAIGKAKGLIYAIAKASHVDGETFTLNDGVHAAVVFEFDVAGNGVTGGRVAVDISGATSGGDVAAIMVTAINGAASLDITASVVAGNKVRLTNDTVGTAGNVAITDTVANADFVYTGMEGGGVPAGLQVYDTSLNALYLYTTSWKAVTVS